jgi:23S rRNA (guanosine2251-2'-O)-methyltransferase
MKSFPSKDRLIMGIHAIQELLLHAPKRLLRVFAENPKKGGRKMDLIELCESKKIPVVFVSKEVLEEMTGSDSHQSVVAEIQERKFLSVKEFCQVSEEKERSLVLMLDQIFDPQNFGALLRCAECLGADAVVWSKNRGSDLTPSAAKASSGASELLNLVRVSNLAETAVQFQEAGYEVVVSLLDEKAENAFEFSFSPRTVLVVGSEGEGIQPLLAKKADHKIYIPMKGSIQSLNVSQSASILMAFYAACALK